AGADGPQFQGCGAFGSVGKKIDRNGLPGGPTVDRHKQASGSAVSTAPVHAGDGVEHGLLSSTGKAGRNIEESGHARRAFLVAPGAVFEHADRVGPSDVNGAVALG